MQNPCPLTKFFLWGKKCFEFTEISRLKTLVSVFLDMKKTYIFLICQLMPRWWGGGVKVLADMSGKNVLFLDGSPNISPCKHKFSHICSSKR